MTDTLEVLFDEGAHHDFVNNDGKTAMDMMMRPATLLAEVFLSCRFLFVVFLRLSLPLLFSSTAVRRLRKRSGKIKNLC